MNDFYEVQGVGFFSTKDDAFLGKTKPGQAIPGAAATQVKVNRPTSRYSSGNPGGPGLPPLPKGKSSSERAKNPRGGGAKGRGIEVDIPTGQPIRGRTGASRGVTAQAASAAAVTPRVIGDGLADVRGGVTPGSMEPAMNNKGEGIQMDIADRFRPGAGYPAGVVRPMDYANAPGQVQPSLGTDTSATRALPELTYDAFSRDILGKMGIGTYAAQKLPGTEGYAESFGLDPAGFEATEGEGGVFNAPKYVIVDGKPALFKAEGEIVAMTEAELQSERQLTPGMSKIEKATSDIKPMEQELSIPERASRAFLDYEDPTPNKIGGSLRALRARDEALDVLLHKGQYYAINRNADPTSDESLLKIEMPKGQATMGGIQAAEAAQDLLKSKLSKVKGEDDELE